MEMNIFVTGSDGFVGKTVSEYLNKDFHVIGCGRRDYSYANVDHYIKWDIGHCDTPRELSKKKIDAIVHMAANKSMDDSELELSYSNVLGMHRIINLCREKNCKRAILLSSLPIAAKSDKGEAIEGLNYDPPTMYHATKAAQELMFYQLNKSGIQAITLRIPSPISPTMTDRTIFTIFGDQAINNEKIVINGKGTRRQNYVDVRDIARVCRELLISERANGIYNFGSEETVSNIELAHKWIKAAKSNSKIVFSGDSDPSDGQDWMVDISRLIEDLGYKPKYPIDITMKDYIIHKTSS